MRLYRWLLRALPRELREEFGADMEQLLRDRLADTASRRARMALWVGAMIDVVRVAVAARLPRRLAGASASIRPLGDLPMEVRLATRALWRNPTYTIAAVATLAVGIGTATAFFSVVNGVLLQPLPFRDADRLISVTSNGMTAENFDTWRRAGIGESVAAISGRTGTAAADVGAAPVSISVADGNFFELLGVQPARGRLLQLADDRMDAAPVAVVREDFWQAHFTGNPLGRSLTIDGRSYEIVGTLPATFAFLRNSRSVVWVAFAHGDVPWGGLIAKLRPGQTVEQAATAWQQFAERLPKSTEQRSTDEPLEVQVQSLSDAMFSEGERRLWIFFGAAILVLLLGAVNVATLAIGRVLARREELAVRAALGAGRFRILRQLVVEAGVIALCGAAAGLMLAQLTPTLMALAPQNLPRREDVGTDGWVLLFTVAAATATVLIFGVAPALAAARGAEQTSLHAASSRVRRSGRAQSAVVIGEVAVALALMIGALLLVQTYAALRPTEPGFQVEDRVVAAFRLPVDRYSFRDDAASRQFAEEVLSGIHALPGAPRAELATNVPLNVQAIMARTIETEDGAKTDMRAWFRSVSANYLDLMRMPIKAGRGLRDSDRAGSQLVTVINETAARTFWNTTDVIGRRLRATDEESDVALEVVGVVRDAWVFPGAQTRPEIFVSFAQLPFNRFMLVIESTAARPVTLRDVRTVVNRVDRGVPVLEFSSMREAIGWSVAAPRFQATLLTLLTIIGIVLAATGCFAVLMQSVGRRTHELGVRMTLGATSGSVARLILRRALALATIGTFLGIGLALIATRLLESDLYGIQRTDLRTFITAAVLVALVMIAAALVPARRVARLDPVQALRHN